jgi:phosphatidylglycerophosphate synthase
VIDDRLRATKDRCARSLVSRLPPAVTPGRLTAVAAFAGLGSGVLAAQGMRWWSLAAWLAGRTIDGLDGTVARLRGQASDRGGYLDLMGDTLGYTAVPLGIAVAADTPGVWAACAVLLGSFYLNTMSWTLLAAVAEKRGSGAAARGQRTTVHMPTGLIEGTETIVLFALMLAMPGQARFWFWFMAALVGATVVQRLVWAWRSLT